MSKDLLPRSTGADVGGAGAGSSSNDGMAYATVDSAGDVGFDNAAELQGGYGNSFVAGTATGTQSGSDSGVPPDFDAAARAEQLHEAMDGWGTDERAILDILYTGNATLTGMIQREYDSRYRPSLAQALRKELSGDTLEKALKLLSQGRMTLADKIREGAKGWGTDEDQILHGLERATAEELAQVRADAAVMQILRDELGTEDLALAMAYLNGQGQLAARLTRAVDGWGTDEAEIWRAIEGATQEERDFIRTQPKLMNALRKDLNGDDWLKCQRLLEGRFDNVGKIEVAIRGWGTDEAALLAALGALTAEEYGSLPADIDEKLESELSGDHYILASDTLHQKRIEYDAEYREQYMARQTEALGEGALMHDGASVLLAQTGETQSAIARLHAACNGMGTDDTTLWQILGSLNASEREFIRDHNPDGILQILSNDLSSGDYDKVLQLLGAGGPAVVMRAAVSGWGTDEALLYEALDSAVRDGQGPTILADGPTMKALRDDLNAQQFRIVQDALATNTFTPMARLIWATLGAGTNEDLVFELCRQYGSQWKQGESVVADVDEILQAELSTREYWQAMDMIRGEPVTEQDRLARAKELLERERNGVSVPIMDAFSNSGENADEAWREYQATYNNALMDGEVSSSEHDLLRRDESYSQRMTQEYAQTKASVAMWATQIAVAIIGTVATILTAGTAGPFVASLAAALGGKLAVVSEAMVLAAIARVGLQRAIEGEGYDLTSSDALLDGIGASLDVGLAVLGGHAASRLMQGMAPSSFAQGLGGAVEDTFGAAGRRILVAGAEGGIDGAIGGMGEGLFRTLADEDTYKGDFEQAFSRVGSQTVLRGTMGGMGGFATAATWKGIAEVYGSQIRAKYGDDPSKYPTPGDGDELDGPIRRTQDDPLPGLRDEHATNVYKDFERGKAFVAGEGDLVEIDPNDVKQGALGDCYFMAGMAATARADADHIRRVIVDNGDGTFDVTLYIRDSYYGPPRAVTRTIDAQLPTRSSGSPLYAGLGDSTDEFDELWPALLEKRLAQEKGSYDLISGGNIGKDFNFNGATELLTGQSERYFSAGSLSEDRILSMMDEALTTNKPITVDSMNFEDEALQKAAEAVNVYGNHAYAVESVDLASRTIRLQNPWGSHHVVDLPIKDFKRFYRAVRVGGGGL